VPAPALTGAQRHPNRTSSGTIREAGTFTRTALDFSDSVDHSPVAAAFQVQFDFIGAAGTITITIRCCSRPTG